MELSSSSSSNLQSRVSSSSSSSYIPPHRTQLHPRMHTPLSSLSSLLPPNPNPKFPPPKDNKYLLILATSLFIIPFFFYLFTITHNFHKHSKFSESKPRIFGIVINAAPTGSKIRVFEFSNERMVSYGAYGSSSIEEVVEFGKRGVPKSEWGNTRVWLRGSRELGERILEKCRRVLRLSGFLFEDEWASVMEDQEEGVYAWVAANYALGTLGKEPQETTGIVELGGASLQVAFAQDDSPAALSKVIKLAGVTYNLYTQSMPHFGQDAVWESLLEIQKSRVLSASSRSEEGIANSPCIPQGYDHTSNASDAILLASHPVGNFSACKSEVMSLLKMRRDKCMHPPCEIVSSFLVESQGKPVPPDKFFFVSEFFGVAAKASLAELEAAGRHYCEDDWYKLKDQHHNIGDLDLLRYCFSSAYLAVLLHESFGISMIDKRIGLANNQAGSEPLDWTLGAFILQTMVEPVVEVERDDEHFGEIVGNEAVTYLSVCAVLLFAVLGVFLLLKLQKPQLKTIYDLEKGRYIVTRIPR
ncbi:hypothetical protein LguiA_021443 [Lonicera macranthoides]